MDFIYLIEDFFKKENGELNILGKVLGIALVFVVIKILMKVLNSFIDRSAEKNRNKASEINEKKFDTLKHVLKNVIRFVLYFIGLMIVLEMVGIDTKSILATAGIGGLAISFGAQSLVKDIITGFSIIAEDHFSVGDYVTIGEYSGIVEELGIRTTKLRDFSGQLHIIPNGNINVVTNNSRGPMRSSVDITIAYDENIDRAIEIIDHVCNNIKEEYKTVLTDGPSVLGVTKLGDSTVTINIIAKTQPMEQWALERAIRKNVKEAFEKEGMEPPYPKMVLYKDKSEEV